MEKGATISIDGLYRYELTRKWSDGDCITFIGLNPSIADDNIDDPTIRRCISFAKSGNFGSLVMVNLFAYRATNPIKMKRANDPIGGMFNDQIILASALKSTLIIAAWGNHGSFMNRSFAVKQMLRGKLYYLRLNKSGEPAHPLYLPKNIIPTKWEY